MYELIALSEHDYYFDCPAKIGLVDLGGGEVVLIDSGSDKDAGKKVWRVLQERGWTLRAIYNTHSHADHIGGNRFLQEKSGCRIYARGMECAFTNFPLLEPMGLYGGQPFADLRHKFLLAQESHAEPLTQETLPAGMTLLELPGHSFDMVGFLTADGTAFVADCVSSEETLTKYGIGYLWDADAAQRTLERLMELHPARFVPSHAPVAEDIVPLAERNLQAMEEVRRRILSFCRGGVRFEELLKKIFDSYAMTMNAQQYALIGSTLRSYLTGLHAKGAVTCSFEDNLLRWSAAAD